MHIFHKWDYYGEREHGCFHGNITTWVPKNIRVCRVCGKTQEYWHCFGGCGWSTLNVSKTDTIHSMIRSEDIEPSEPETVLD